MTQSAAFEWAYRAIINHDPDGLIRAEAARLVGELEWFAVKAWNVTRVWAHSAELSVCIHLGAATGPELFERYVTVDVYFTVMRQALKNIS